MSSCSISRGSSPGGITKLGRNSWYGCCEPISVGVVRGLFGTLGVPTRLCRRWGERLVEGRGPGYGVLLGARIDVVHQVLQRGRLPPGWGCSRGDGGSGLLRFCCAVGALEPDLNSKTSG